MRVEQMGNYAFWGAFLVRESDGIVIGQLELRPHERAVLVSGRAVPLTCGELDILTTLAEHPGWVFSADDLTSDPADHDHSPESVSVLVSRLRQKLATAGAPDVVDTVRGFGYRLRRAGGSAVTEAASTARTSRATEDDVDAQLRDAAWRLQEAVVDAERSSDRAAKLAVAAELDRALRAIRPSSP